MGKCCKNKKKIKRECKGESATCKCKGDAVIEEDCKCDPYDYKCQIENRICSFSRYTDSWSRFGFKSGAGFRFNSGDLKQQLEGLLGNLRKNKNWSG